MFQFSITYGKENASKVGLLYHVQRCYPSRGSCGGQTALSSRVTFTYRVSFLFCHMIFTTSPTHFDLAVYTELHAKLLQYSLVR